MKLKDGFLSFVEGSIIGISSLIPNLSSGSVMYSLNIYNHFVEGVSKLFKKNNKKLYLIVIPIFLGLLAGIIGGVHIISYGLKHFSNQIIFLFVGLLIGGFKINYKKAKIKLNTKSFIVFLLLLIVLVSIYFLLRYIKVSLLGNVFLKFIFGLILGLTSLIPGIPISSYLLSFDKYNSLSKVINFSSFTGAFGFVLFIFGLALGIVLISKLIYYLLKKHKYKINFVLLSLLIGSIIILLFNINSFIFNFKHIFTCLLSFLWGYILALNVETENDR